MDEEHPEDERYHGYRGSKTTPSVNSYIISLLEADEGLRKFFKGQT